MSVSVFDLTNFLIESIKNNFSSNSSITEIELLKKTPDDSEVSGFKIITADKSQILVCVLSDKK